MDSQNPRQIQQRHFSAKVNITNRFISSLEINPYMLFVAQRHVTKSKPNPAILPSKKLN